MNIYAWIFIALFIIREIFGIASVTKNKDTAYNVGYIAMSFVYMVLFYFGFIHHG